MAIFRKGFPVLLVTVLLLGLMVCGESGYVSAANTKRPIKIIYAGTVPDTHPITLAMFEFKRVLEKMSEGRIVVETFPNNQLGSSRETLEGVQRGNIQMCDSSMSNISGFSPKAIIMSLPFLFPSREVAFEFFDGKFGQEMVNEITKDTGIYIIGFYESGFRQLTNSKRTIRAPKDMEGLKFRVMENPIYIKTFEAFGASATPMAWAELFTALQQKTVDGQDNPWGVSVDCNFHTVNKYLTDLNYLFDCALVYMNKKFYDGLPEDLRAMVEEAMHQAELMQRKVSVDTEQKYITRLKAETEYTELTAAERNAFKEKVAPVYEWYVKEYNDGARLKAWQEEIERLSRK